MPDAAGNRQPASGPPAMPIQAAPEPSFLDLPETNLPDTPPIRSYQASPQASQKPRKSGKRPARKIPASWAIGGIGLLVLVSAVVVLLQVDFGDLRPTAIVNRLQAKLDSSASIKRDLESLSTRIETVGRAVATGDESEATAARLLAFESEFDDLILRACRLDSEARDLDEVTIKLHKDRPRSMSRGSTPGASTNGMNQPSEKVFWMADLTAPSEKKVTGAITKLALKRGSVYRLVDINPAELPDPLVYQDEVLDWTDEDRRVLAITRMRGQLKRDFARQLALIDPDSPSESDFASLHSIVDAYAERAKSLIDKSGKNKMIAFVPKGTVYHRQESASMVAMAAVIHWFSKNQEPGRNLEFLFGDVRQLDEDIDQLVFRPRGTPLVLSEATSAERFQSLLDDEAKAEQKLIAEQKREEERRRKEEAAKLAEREREKKAAEELARKAAEDPPALASDTTSGDQGMPNDAPQNRRFGANASGRPGFGASGFGPPGFGPSGPRSRPGFDRPGANSRFGGGMPGGEGRGSAGGNATAEVGPNDVTIEVADAGNVDTRDLVQSLPQWLRKKYSITISNNNGKLTIRIRNFDRELSELAGGFPSLQFEKTDTVKRVITADIRE